MITLAVSLSDTLGERLRFCGGAEIANTFCTVSEDPIALEP